MRKGLGRDLQRDVKRNGLESLPQNEIADGHDQDEQDGRGEEAAREEDGNTTAIEESAFAVADA